MSDHPPTGRRATSPFPSAVAAFVYACAPFLGEPYSRRTTTRGSFVLFFLFLIEVFFFPEPSEIDGRLRAEFLYLFILFSLPFKAQLLILVSFPPLLSSLLLFPLFSFSPPIIFH